MDVLYYDILYTHDEFHFLMAKDCLPCNNIVPCINIVYQTCRQSFKNIFDEIWLCLSTVSYDV